MELAREVLQRDVDWVDAHPIVLPESALEFASVSLSIQGVLPDQVVSPHVDLRGDGTALAIAGFGESGPVIPASVCIFTPNIFRSCMLLG